MVEHRVPKVQVPADLTLSDTGSRAARQVAEAAERFVGGLIRANREMLGLAGLSGVADRAATALRSPAGDFVGVLSELGDGSTPQVEVAHTAFEVATWRLWLDGKVVYRLDPTLFAALDATDPTTEIPVEVFHRVPHPCPLFVFPEPVTIVESGEEVEFHAMLVCGATGMSGPASPRVGAMTDPFDVVSVLLFGSTVDENGERLGQEVRRHGLDVTEPRSVEDLVRLSLGRYRPVVPVSDEELWSNTGRLLQLAVSLLLYVASDEPDIDRVEVPTRRRKGRIRPSQRPAEVMEVGWRVGASLRAAASGL